MNTLYQRFYEDLKHIHYIVAGAGMSNDGKRWLKIKNNKFLLHVMPLSRRFQHLFRQALANTLLYESIPHSTWNKDWVVHCESAGYGQEIIKYLAPYIFKVAMSNHSKLVLEDGKVTFTYKGNQKFFQPNPLNQRKINPIPGAWCVCSRLVQHRMKARLISFARIHPLIR